MNAAVALDRLEAVLGEEREAIIGMSSATVALLATEKETLLARVLERRAAGEVIPAARFAPIVRALRENSVLLAHGRDCLRDAMLAVARDGAVVSESPRGVAPRRGARLSVSG